MERKPLRECLEILLNAESKDEKEKQELDELGIKDYTLSMVISKKLVDQARQGNLKAYNIIQGTIHETPTETETISDTLKVF